ncbi:HlyD family type I secretion periplasmic adaptor subunit [Mesorhizobium sp. M4B.F.Ca.ET.215.01.1.1]|uniref:HlyD family type I secretion periplasmic adaptor subunit n=1 Tax=unclassified Mesorhizobium TaxID=325217 RepID=UPI000FCCCB36|nr:MULTISPECIES: HlyD family type I secretion periplasmic adaptor subunit [unclassified Mesorhizobium]RUW23989.1 HlyD family type I secretion periplasmic adaptor subunit [Mesorhizobium sp. M4B.F.Ca.ET.013.02.1.1]RVD34973.1 HlyD family type I secretion periplasmic adaptor subunit [Mesorhizobium sp. M4B.F.Ca.ET.019.03.1.1]RWF60035.1 MAG: HlyD family type I secretion periplasmic adaptor subunit [Mesorhizobium sp.]TGQ09412.1 HlyD family type I secretion periplasmic adaptor subunit [Mesorhizobium sp
MTTDIAKVHDIEWYSEVPRSIWKQTAVGLLLITVAFGGFGTWASTAPLASAIIAQGSFVATGQNKIVQHLEGGIIKEILVSEGDHVSLDQPLIKLDETAAQTNERQLFLRKARLEAISARLNAEVQGSPSIQFPAIVLDNRYDPEITPIMESQQLNFEAAERKRDSEIALFDQNKKAMEFRNEGIDEQISSVRRQLQFLKEEYLGKQKLLDQGLIRGTEVKAIQRAMADADGQIGKMVAEVSENREQIVRFEQQITQTKDAYRQAALQELQSLEAELDAVREQSREAENVLRRVTINAPVPGTIIRMYYHTAGGVIESGKAILEILPSDVPLVIEAQVPRTDIDNVKVGQKASIRLIALNRRTTPVLEGEVYYVSADALPEMSGPTPKEVYLARVRLPASELARVHGFQPTPGMPAEILVQTQSRTFFSYLTKPIADSMARAFMEQ